MKMIIAIIENNLSNTASSALLEEGFGITRLASTGGFLREGATTLMVGVEDEMLDTALQILRDKIPISDDTEEENATIYVLNVRDFKRV
jgi:uncharacterized protein YaaQ